MPRLRRGPDPRGGLVEEEVHRPGPGEQRREGVDRRLPRDALAVPGGDSNGTLLPGYVVNVQ